MKNYKKNKNKKNNKKKFDILLVFNDNSRM